MVTIPKRGKDPYLTAQHVEDDDLAEIVEAPYIMDAEKSKFGKERTIVTVQLKRTDETYRWGLNNTSNDRLVEAFGGDGDLWLGKTVKIAKRTENVRGQDRSVLYAIPLEQKNLES
jgi:hypothetical protein